MKRWITFAVACGLLLFARESLASFASGLALDGTTNNVVIDDDAETAIRYDSATSTWNYLHDLAPASAALTKGDFLLGGIKFTNNSATGATFDNAPGTGVGFVNALFMLKVETVSAPRAGTGNLTGVQVGDFTFVAPRQAEWTSALDFFYGGAGLAPAAIATKGAEGSIAMFFENVGQAYASTFGAGSGLTTATSIETIHQSGTFLGELGFTGSASTDTSLNGSLTPGAGEGWVAYNAPVQPFGFVTIGSGTLLGTGGASPAVFTFALSGITGFNQLQFVPQSGSAFGGTADVFGDGSLKGSGDGQTPPSPVGPWDMYSQSTLNLAAIPEPSSVVALVGMFLMIGGLGLLRFRRK